MERKKYPNDLYKTNEAYTIMALLRISRPATTYPNIESRECDHCATARNTATTTNLWGSTSTASWSGARSRFAAGAIYATDANTTGASNPAAGFTANHCAHDSVKFFKCSTKNLGWW